MRCRCVWEQSLTVEDKEFVHSIGQNLIFNLALDTSSCNNSMQFYAQFIGQFAALGQQFL